MNNVLWSPSSSAKIDSKMALFIRYINKKYDMSINNYSDLHRWSIDNIELFWRSISDFFKIKYSSKAKSIFKPSNKINKNKWFQGASLNREVRIGAMNGSCPPEQRGRPHWEVHLASAGCF